MSEAPPCKRKFTARPLLHMDMVTSKVIFITEHFAGPKTINGSIMGEHFCVRTCCRSSHLSINTNDLFLNIFWSKCPADKICPANTPFETSCLITNLRIISKWRINRVAVAEEPAMQEIPVKLETDLKTSWKLQSLDEPHIETVSNNLNRVFIF